MRQKIMTIAIKCRQLIDCTGADPISDAVVLVKGEKIQAVGSASQVNIPAETRIINVGDDTVLPGLIDAHEHLGLNLQLGNESLQVKVPDVEYAFRMAWAAKTDLMSGITTVRTCGDKNSLDLLCKKAIQDGFIPGPRIIAAGAGIKATHGHGYTATTIANGADSVRAAIREHIYLGVDHIKLFVTAASGTPRTVPWQTYYTRDEILAAVEEAHRMNMTVSVHCHGGVGADWCIEGGVDSIEHGNRCTMAQYEKMVQKGIWLVPTLHILQPLPYDENVANRVAKKKEGRELWAENFPKLLDLGIKIAAGTDALHGMLWRELEFMTSLGMKPMAALLTATRNAADLCKRLDCVGTLEKGKLADIIAVRGDPLSDITCLKNASLVMKGGECCVPSL